MDRIPVALHNVGHLMNTFAAANFGCSVQKFYLRPLLRLLAAAALDPDTKTVSGALLVYRARRFSEPQHQRPEGSRAEQPIPLALSDD